jgi:LAO/AO transport system kinase
MEMADGIVINKADGENVQRAQLAASHFRNALHLFPPTDSGWVPQVLTYSGYYDLGIKEIREMIDAYIAFTKASGYFDHKRNEQSRYWMYESIQELLRNAFYHHPEIERLLPEMEQKVLSNELSSFVAARQLIDLFLTKDR